MWIKQKIYIKYCVAIVECILLSMKQLLSKRGDWSSIPRTYILKSQAWWCAHGDLNTEEVRTGWVSLLVRQPGQIGAFQTQKGPCSKSKVTGLQGITPHASAHKCTLTNMNSHIDPHMKRMSLNHGAKHREMGRLGSWEPWVTERLPAS